MYVFQPQPLYVTLNKDYYMRVDIRAYAISSLTQPLTKTNKSLLPPSLYAKWVMQGRGINKQQMKLFPLKRWRIKNHLRDVQQEVSFYHID